MRDVAQTAGVSIKTVSRVVNDEPGVTPALEARVRDAVERLGYQPDDRARYLRRTAGTSRRSATIGFVQMDVANPFFSAMFRGLEDAAKANGSLVLAGSSDADPVRQDELIDTFVARRVDGLVIATRRGDLETLDRELRHGTPVVFVDQEPPALVGDVVRTDHRGGATIATRHLIDHGHRRIAFLGDDPELFSAAERRAGFLDVMAAAGLRAPLVETGVVDTATAAATTERLLDLPEPPTALFTAQNLITVGALIALHRHGLADRVALVGFDEIDAAELIHPRPTVIPQDPRRIGRLAGERLFARLAGDTDPPGRTILEPQLIPRGSGEIRPPAT
ncbi:MAG: LacI family DNA-binding transcriptional regulator [Actinomycetota bacterium]